MKLLIVDDEMDSYDNFINDLHKYRDDVEVKIVPNALKAFKELSSSNYELIILDQVMGGGEKDGTALLRNLKEKFANYQPQIIFVTAKYNELPIDEIIRIDMPITIFIEKDPSFDNTLLVATQLLIKRIDTKIHYDPIDLFGDRFIEQIMNESDEILKKHISCYMSIIQQRQIGTLVRSFMSSLKMRSKWDADDVLDLSIFFAQSLCGVFNIPFKLIEVLKNFFNLEEVLYTIPHYRDHFFHQIKVFFLGFCIINTLNRHGFLKNTLLGKEKGMKIWFITSVFHDIGYPFEKMKRWLNSYIEGTLRSPGDKEGEELIPIEFHWGNLLGKRFHAFHLERIARKVCKLYDKNSPEILAEILAEFTSFVVSTPDHGLYSSLIVQNFLGYIIDDEEVSPIATSIALHNDEVAKIIRRVIGPQTFEKDPLSFLLAFCDRAQDWGRIRPIGVSKSDYAKFGYPVFNNVSIFDKTSNTIRIILRYNRRFTQTEIINWRKNVFEKYLEPAEKCWKVYSNTNPGLKFCIEYHTISEDEPVIEKLMY